MSAPSGSASIVMPRSLASTCGAGVSALTRGLSVKAVYVNT